MRVEILKPPGSKCWKSLKFIINSVKCVKLHLCLWSLVTIFSTMHFDACFSKLLEGQWLVEFLVVSWSCAYLLPGLPSAQWEWNGSAWPCFTWGHAGKKESFHNLSALKERRGFLGGDILKFCRASFESDPWTLQLFSIICVVTPLNFRK